MQTFKLPVYLLLFVSVALVTGCVSQQQYKDLQLKNATQVQRITDLESRLDAAGLKLGQCEQQLMDAKKLGDIEGGTLKDRLAVCEEDLKRKKDLIEKMQAQLLGGVALPVELSTMLDDFAKQNSDMVTFDASRGLVKFKSDLLFEKGSDVVAPTAVDAVKALCNILNTEQAKEFDVIIAGHTDDIPIARPETRLKHPTNWHLSAHRAISVLNVMTGSAVDPTRVSERGFGEFRPVVPNEPGKKGNAQNRRVEIFIVPRGV